MWGWWAKRPVLAAAVVYALLALVFVGQGLLPGRTLSNADMLWSGPPFTATTPEGVRSGGANFELADASSVFHPFFEHARREMGDGLLWNPRIMAGRPFLANAQSALFSPFTVPAYVLPLDKALGVIAVLKLFVAAFGTFLLARGFGMRFGGALLAGVVFAFGTYFMVWLAWPLTNIFPLIPWLLLVTELLVRRPGPLPAAALAALIALAFFGGHPETTFHVTVATGVFFVFRTLVAWRAAGRRRRDLIRPSAAFGLGLAGGAGIAAVMLAPLLELFVLSADYARRLTLEPSHSEARYLGALFLSDYWGRPTQTPLIANIVSNRGWYAGGITLMLALVALVLRPTLGRVAIVVGGLVTAAIVLGIEPFFAAVTTLPGFSTAHNGRLAIFVLLALALLAGWGLDDLSRRELAPLGRRRLALAGAAVLLVIPVGWMLAAGTLVPRELGAALKIAWGFADPPRMSRGEFPSPAVADSIRLSALLQWLPLAGAGLALVALRLAPRQARPTFRLPVAAFAALALGVLVADLFRANMGYNPAIPVSHAQQPATPSIRVLQADVPNRFAVLSRAGIDQPLQPDLSMRYGLYDARGYDYPIEKRYDTFWRATAGFTGDSLEPTQRAGRTPQAVRGLSLLSVSSLLQYPGDDLSRLPGLREVYSGRDAKVYRNTNALPRTFLVDRQRVVPSADAALAATISPRFDARRVAITERRVPGVAEEGAAAGGPPGTARLASYENHRVLVTARAARSSLLLLTDVHFPGWKATVDGEPATIERADYLLRGVRVPAGAHRVEFRYEPASWRIGWIVSCVALVAVALAALVGWRRRREVELGS